MTTTHIGYGVLFLDFVQYFGLSAAIDADSLSPENLTHDRVPFHGDDVDGDTCTSRQTSALILPQYLHNLFLLSPRTKRRFLLKATFAHPRDGQIALLHACGDFAR
jgi:hypothetical protein